MHYSENENSDSDAHAPSEFNTPDWIRCTLNALSLLRKKRSKNNINACGMYQQSSLQYVYFTRVHN